MKFTETRLAGAFIVNLERRVDERGYFARTFCQREFSHHGLCTQWVQCNVSFNARRGTLRGLHFQSPPHDEVKLVTCIRGRVWDVIVDLRPGSPTFAKHVAVELCAEEGRAVYIPAGFAHGFQTLEDDSTLFYQMGAFYEPTAVRGIRFDDPGLGIAWPVPEMIVGERDRKLPELARGLW